MQRSTQYTAPIPQAKTAKTSKSTKPSRLSHSDNTYNWQAVLLAQIPRKPNPRARLATDLNLQTLLVPLNPTYPQDKKDSPYNSSNSSTSTEVMLSPRTGQQEQAAASTPHVDPHTVTQLVITPVQVASDTHSESPSTATSSDFMNETTPIKEEPVAKYDANSTLTPQSDEDEQSIPSSKGILSGRGYEPDDTNKEPDQYEPSLAVDSSGYVYELSKQKGAPYDTKIDHEFTYDDGTKYNGKVNAEGKPHGEGSLTYPKYDAESTNSSFFDGTFENGQIVNGNFTYEDGSFYYGDMTDGTRHGQGTYESNGNEYSGAWHNDQMHGEGTFTTNYDTENAQEYTGVFSQNFLGKDNFSFRF